MQRGPGADPIACRFCSAGRLEVVVDLGKTPLANSYRPVGAHEEFFPLVAYLCTGCFLVQVPEVAAAATIFRNYAYRSSMSASWLEHARAYARAMIGRLDLDGSSQVIEIGSNDGYLLRNFSKAGIPALGVDPAANLLPDQTTAGFQTIAEFFGVALARRMRAGGIEANLLVGNNVLPHVPDINDFVEGIRILLAPDGVVTLEFPWLLELLRQTEFDTIYHEHYSYLSLLTAGSVLGAHGLRVVDVEVLGTHGGSLRVFAKHAGRAMDPSAEVERVLEIERRYGLTEVDTYRDFAHRVEAVRESVHGYLTRLRDDGRTAVGYGAPAKATTLLNYCRIGPDLLAFTVDRNPDKQGKALPGTGIPIFGVEKLAEAKPDYILILPWNLREEIVGELAEAKAWGARLVVPLPDLEVVG